MESGFLQTLLELAVSLLPVIVFLSSLILLDSYKLVRLRFVLMAIGYGIGAAGVALATNTLVLSGGFVEPTVYVRYGAPVVEEAVKSVYIIYLIRSRRIGFMVDAAIYGFAIGSGFALIENLYYLQSLSDPNLFVWVIRGLGTAIMHGGTTAIVGLLGKSLSDMREGKGLVSLLPGFAIAVAIHSAFNHLLLPPLYSTLSVLVIIPAILIYVFHRSELATQDWLGVGFDTDKELLEMITTHTLSETNVGAYLRSLEDRFPGAVVVDMLCLLRLHLELSISAKGVLMMREAGFDPDPDPEIHHKFDELHFLEKSIGPTGKLAMKPILHISDRDLWQLHLLKKS